MSKKKTEEKKQTEKIQDFDMLGQFERFIDDILLQALCDFVNDRQIAKAKLLIDMIDEIKDIMLKYL